MVSVPEQFRELLRTQPLNGFASVLINHGRGFIISDRFGDGGDIGNGDSIYLYVDNPADSGYDYDVLLLPRSTGLADLDISFNATEDTQGTDSTVNNLKSGSSRTFSGVARQTTTGETGGYSHGTTFYSDFIPGGGSGANIAGQVVDAIAFTVDEGENKLLELRNEAGGGVKRMALQTLVLEVDGTFKEVPES